MLPILLNTYTNLPTRHRLTTGSETEPTTPIIFLLRDEGSNSYGHRDCVVRYCSANVQSDLQKEQKEKPSTAMNCVTGQMVPGNSHKPIKKNLKRGLTMMGNIDYLSCDGEAQPKLRAEETSRTTRLKEIEGDDELEKLIERRIGTIARKTTAERITLEGNQLNVIHACVVEMHR